MLYKMMRTLVYTVTKAAVLAACLGLCPPAAEAAGTLAALMLDPLASKVRGEGAVACAQRVHRVMTKCVRCMTASSGVVSYPSHCSLTRRVKVAAVRPSRDSPQPPSLDPHRLPGRSDGRPSRKLRGTSTADNRFSPQ